MLSICESKNQTLFSHPLIKNLLCLDMVRPDQCRKAAEEFLDKLADRIHHLPKPYSTQAQLAKAAGVSGPTITDYKNKKKTEAPEFKKVFQTAYALLGRSPCTLEEPPNILNLHFAKALESDKHDLLHSLARIILEAPAESPALQFVKSSIETALNQIQPNHETQDSAV